MADDEKKTEEGEEAVVEEAVVEEAVVEEAVAEETPEPQVVVEEPAVEETAVDEPVAEEAVVEEAVPEEVAEPDAAVEEDAVEEPVVEEAAAEPPAAAVEVEAVAETVEAAPVKKQKSRKHVPRSERRKRSVPAREVLKERKPIVRLPKPEYDRAARQERRGVVVSDKADKTIIVKVDVTKLHPRYKKVVRRSVKFHAHDETNQAGIGDIVRIVETRPLSKTKCWRLAEIVEKAK
jgi:small subunit ribosomal protein S17